MNLIELRNKIHLSFNMEELKDLCFEMEIVFDDLPGSTLKDKVRELVLFCERHNRIEELQSICQRLRPNQLWESNQFVPIQSLYRNRAQLKRFGLWGSVIVGIFITLLFVYPRFSAGNVGQEPTTEALIHTQTPLLTNTGIHTATSTPRLSEQVTEAPTSLPTTPIPTSEKSDLQEGSTQLTRTVTSTLPSPRASPTSWQAITVITLQDDSQTEVSTDSFRINGSGDGMTFSDGITVSYRDISSIEVVETTQAESGLSHITAQVLLVNGETRETEYSITAPVSGDSELGEFSKLISDVKRIDFQSSAATAIITLQDESQFEAEADSIGIIHYVLVKGLPLRTLDTTILFETMQSVEISEYDLTITLLDGTVIIDKLEGARPSNPFVGHARFNEFSLQIREVKRIDFQLEELNPQEETTEMVSTVTETVSNLQGVSTSWEATTVITLQDDSKTVVPTDSFRINGRRDGVTFSDGITVSFRDMNSIEVVGTTETESGLSRIKVQVMLVNGEIREAEYSTTAPVSGDSELGEFSKRISDVKQIEFRPSVATAVITLQDGSQFEAEADSIGIIHYVTVKGLPLRMLDTTILFETMQSVEISEYDLTITLLDGTILTDKIEGATPSSPLVGHTRFNDFSLQFREVKRIDFQR